MRISIDTAYAAAHPRSRGENLGLFYVSVSIGGSPPLTRGKLPSRAGTRPVPRLIPAHAGKTCGYTLTPRLAPAHPRSRGENLATREYASACQGSSPLTRGKPPCTRPAPALPAAHPRSRGENTPTMREMTNELGSSPLTRGKHFLTCAFTAQIDQILESLELAVSSGSYSIWVACATDAPQDQVQSIGLVLPSSRDAS